MFDIPPRCPAIADKLTGIFSWRHTYRVHHRHKGIAQGSHGHLHKTYSLQLPNNNKKNADSWVVVHHLQSQSGILDPDDKLNDVADDREQIIASYDDCPGPDPGVPQGGGDGASGSSVGTGSPDIFTRSESKFPMESTHIEVTSSEQTNTSGLGLQVRRGSEPSLHQIGDSPHPSNQPFMNSSGNGNTSGSNAIQDPTKRWSAAPVCRSDTDPPERLLAHHIATMNGGTSINATTTVPEEEIPYSSHNESNHSAFSRSGRLSMQFLGDGGGYRWLDAADRVATNNTSFNSHQNVSNANSYYNSKSLPREAKRKEPLGQANAHEALREKNGEMLLVINEQGSPLGLTAIPDPENGGLLVQHVEAGSRAEKGRLRRGDLIVEINSIQLIGLGDKNIQEQLRRNLQSSELRLRVIRSSKNKRDNRVSKLIDTEEKTDEVKGATKTSPNRKVPGATASASLQAANTRKLGRKIEITLKKGPQGLGFSVTTRDNPAGGYCPIYIKNILPKGAAVEDGRLKSGDRLLEVDGVTMTGKSQTEVVGILRATQPGATVRLVVSRQQELVDVEEREIGCGAETEKTKDTPPKPPAPVMPQSAMKSPPKVTNPLPVPEKPNDRPAHLNLSASLRLKRRSSGGSQNSPVYAGFNLQDNNSVFPWRNREILTLHIPVHDTEKAGLGVSVKGKTGSPNNSNGSSGSSNGVNLKNDGDLGIFVKSVIHGGAASRDGRLKMNDQLLSVNGVSLLGQSNAEAMDTLRRAMLHTGGKYPGSITLTVARRISRPASIGDPLDSEHSTTSENSGATVVYLNSSDKVDKMNTSDSSMNRWSNPVLDRLTGGTGLPNPGSARPKPSPLPSAMRNESYYMATNETWSPTGMHLNGSNAVLIEEDPEPTSPALPSRINDSRLNESNNKNISAFSMQNGDVAYDSQLSLETNPPNDAFNRDAVGRRSMSEKHHAALDAKETGTYQRNKKLREERERREKVKMALSGSMESLADAVRNSQNVSKTGGDLRGEEADKVTDLGPSLGMKKSSSLESLQTMVQEIQMSDEPRGPVSLKTPRGPGRADQLRAVVERPPQESKPRKHWLLEDASTDQEGGFTNRNSPFQSSLNDPKRNKQKKPGLFKGIGHMFRFGKHRKDGVVPVISNPTPIAAVQQDTGLIKPESNGWLSGKSDEQERKHSTATLPAVHGHQRSSPAVITTQPKERNGPPQYISPPPAPNQSATTTPTSATTTTNLNSTTLVNGQPTAIHQNDLFNHRYSHYVNYDELQHHLSRRHHIYHSTRSTRELSTTHHSNMNSSASSTLGHNFNSRPISTYYEYETATFQPQGSMRKVSNSPIISVQHNKVLLQQQQQQQQQQKYPQWNGTSSTSGGSIKNRGPFVTQVTIRDMHQTSGGSNQPPASKV